MLKLVTFAALCLGALFVASHADEDRRCLQRAAAVLAINWLLFSMPWIHNGLSPAHLAKMAGLPLTHLDAWAMQDLASLIVTVTICRHCWWAPMLWTPYLSNLVTYAVAYTYTLEYIDFSWTLDGALIVQLAAIFMLGGGGCADFLRRCCRGVRHLGSGSIQDQEAHP